MRKILFLVLFCLGLTFTLNAQNVTQGGLEAVGKDGKSLGACPLKNTKVQAEITGFLSRVKVTQEFENNFSEKIEAVYVFPLPQNAAVDDMTMRIGERVVRGKIMRREEARAVYEAAKSGGQIASLLDQERPNIFTQSVANILPGEKILIEISYVETLKYEDGSYEFVFPMTVGPRYIPASVKQEDAQKITPPIAKERAGHDISIEIILDAGVPIDNLASKSHEIESTFRSAASSLVKLKHEKTIPNKDFILRYDVAGKKIEDAILAHRSEKGGYFTLILQPPDKVAAQDVTPKEIVFVLDTSGSMSGFPIEKAKESMKLALAGLNPQDTFNLITFAGDTSILFEKPVSATSENLQKAQAFLESRQGVGGTEMMKAIRAALDPSDSQQHLRIVCFMTDGYVGNDMEIIAEIQKHPNARVFSFGIGSSVNRLLLDKMAEEGRGDVEYVSLNDDGSAAAKRFHERIRSPLLTDISVDFGGLQVADVYPKRINDLFSAKPVIIYGRFTKPGSGTIRLKGRSFGREVVREIPVNFPENAPDHDVLATLWARTRIADLMSQDYENKNPEIKEAIINLGIEYRLLTQFTSFVAVEERVVTDGGQPRRIDVPVELPEGVNSNITREVVENLPSGTTFTSLLKINPNVRPIASSGGFQAEYGGAAGGVVNVTTDSNATIDPSDTKIETNIVRGDGFQVDGASGSENSFVIDGQEAANFRSEAALKSFKATATKLPKPPVSRIKSGIKKEGEDIPVQVLIDGAGNVLRAVALNPNEAIRPYLEQAARGAKFKIDQPSRSPFLITGMIVYRFRSVNGDLKVWIELKNFAVKLTPEEQKRRDIAAKTSATIFNLIERLRDPKIQPGPDEAKFVADGKAEVIVRLKELNPETIEVLKNSGLEILTELASAKAVIGRITIEKLAGLTELEGVTFIAPQYR